jgi:hypothetical protein
MRPELVLLPLLQKHPFEALSHAPLEDHVRDTRGGVDNREQACQVAAGLNERHGSRRTPCLDWGCLGPVNEVTELLGEAAMALASSVGCDLHRDRIEAGIVAVCMALEECLDLF